MPCASSNTTIIVSLNSHHRPTFNNDDIFTMKLLSIITLAVVIATSGTVTAGDCKKIGQTRCCT